MFTAMIARFRKSVSTTVGSVLGRAAIALLFLVAAVFAVAAITLALIDRFGSQTAYWILAFAFAVIGGLVAMILSAKEEEAKIEEEAEAEAASAASSMFSPEVAIAAVSAVAPLLASPTSAAMALRMARLGVRNMPLLVLAVFILVLMWPYSQMRPPAGREQSSVPPQA